MSKQFKELIAVAREWLDLTREDGDGHKRYCDQWVNCYHAGDSDHAAAKFGIWPHQLEITLLDPLRISGTVLALDKVDEYVAKARSSLDSTKQEKAKRTEQEIEAARRERIERLTAELDSLQRTGTPVGEAAHA